MTSDNIAGQYKNSVIFVSLIAKHLFFTLNDTKNLFCVTVQTETKNVISFNAVTERRVCFMFPTVFCTNLTNSALHTVVTVK